jgi:hypothetical protein
MWHDGGMHGGGMGLLWLLVILFLIGGILAFFKYTFRK